MANLTDRRSSVDVTANKTLALADSGIVQNVVGDGITITLPSTVLGANFIVRAGGVQAGATPGSVQDGAQTITLAPQSTDGIAGNGFTAAVNKGAQLGASAASKKAGRTGDEIFVHGTGAAGASGYVVQRVTGVWTRVA